MMLRWVIEGRTITVEGNQNVKHRRWARRAQKRLVAMSRVSRLAIMPPTHPSLVVKEVGRWLLD